MQHHRGLGVVLWDVYEENQSNGIVDPEERRPELLWRTLSRKRTTDISEWDKDFIAVDQEMLFEIILAANYLDIKPLLYVLAHLPHSCQAP